MYANFNLVKKLKTSPFSCRLDSICIKILLFFKVLIEPLRTFISYLSTSTFIKINLLDKFSKKLSNLFNLTFCLDISEKGYFFISKSLGYRIEDPPVLLILLYHI